MNWQQIAADAIAAGLLIPPEPPKAVEPKPTRMTLEQIRARGKWPSFEAHKERLRTRICAVPTCGKPAKFSERLGRHIERCEECARKNCENTLRRQHART